MTLQEEKGFAQTVRVPSYGGGGILINRHITFIVTEKAHIPHALFTVYVGKGGWLKTPYGRRRLAENVRIPSFGKGFKIV